MYGVLRNTRGPYKAKVPFVFCTPYGNYIESQKKDGGKRLERVWKGWKGWSPLLGGIRVEEWLVRSEANAYWDRRGPRPAKKGSLRVRRICLSTYSHFQLPLSLSSSQSPQRRPRHGVYSHAVSGLASRLSIYPVVDAVPGLVPGCLCPLFCFFQYSKRGMPFQRTDALRPDA